MQPDNEGNLLEIMDLARTLRQEQLFIQSEQSAFRNLNEQLSRSSALVCQLAWICAQQRQNLSDLITSRPETGPSACCQRSNRLENTKFVDAFKAKGLKYEYTIHYIELFNYLYRSPYVVAKCLSAADGIAKISQEQLSVVVNFISTGLYGNGMHSKDIEMLLKLLRDLIEIQIVVNDNPRRMLRAGSSAFARLYHRLHESMFSSKIFLTAALYEPLMRVLVNSDKMLEIDTRKVLESLPQKERVKMFGEENDPTFEANIRKYQEETIEQLYTLANNFIESITKNWSLFPSTLRWLVQTMNHQLKLTHISEKEINEIITDMVFTHFICATIVSPDLFGISDAPISEESRFNLIQIGQIIQMLALMKYNGNTKFDRLYKKFKPNAVSRLLDTFMVNNAEEGVMAFHSQQIEFERSHVLCTQNELNTFTEFLRNVLENDELIISGDDRRQLGKSLNHLPEKFDTLTNGDSQGSPTHSSDGHGSRSKNSLINLGKSTKNKLAKTISLGVNGASNGDEHDLSSYNGSPVHVLEDSEQIIMFPITISDENVLRPLTEEEVLKMNSIGQDIVDDSVLNLENIDKLEKSNQITGHLRPLPPKNTRFSISHDDASIGNSDNLEAVSEAPSNHSSVTSSLELEENDQNDNLSDMVSANVSGRGSPNISGRDTPSSQVTDGESVNQIPTPQMAKIIQKNRSDIDDKFCKFEIRNQIQGDETVSIVSDTWSTDVLASDSETVESSNERTTDRNFSTPLIPAAVVLPGDNNFHLEVADTRSESNWSTDVLASDSEKLTEIDTDDNQSVTARSDITDPNRSNPPDSPFFAPRHSNSEEMCVSREISRYLPSVSSLARSSVRTTNQFSGENNFQQNYKSSNDRASSFLAQKSAMRRQNSAESSISNQSYSLDEARALKVETGTKQSKDLIDFGDFQEEQGAAATPTEDVEAFNQVVHRRVSSDQRSTAFDGRRNGVKDPKANTSSSIFHKFENHEVVIRRVNSATTTTTIRNISSVSSSIIDSPLTDDLKTQRQQQQQQQNNLMDEICEKTEELNLNNIQTSTPSTSSQATKPTKATGAIPKSISFDASADKSMVDRRRRAQQQESLGMRSQGSSGILNKIKSGFRLSRNNNSSKNNRSTTSEDSSRNVSFGAASENVEILEPVNDQNGAVGGGAFDISEDILEKYRRKASSEGSEATNSDSTGGLSNRKLSDGEIRVSINGFHDTVLSFGNVKKKIRAVLSNTDQHTVDFRYTTNPDASPLLSYLQIQLAQALNVQNFEQIAYISEAIRCVTSLDDNCQMKILKEIQADVEKRQSYLQYLMRYRQNLLLILESIEQYENRLTADREMSNKQLIVACIRMFLEKQENMIVNFQEEFSGLSIVDEKLDLLEEFVEKLMMELREGGILYGMVDWQLDEARVSIERILLHRLYKQVMFPNEDVDLSRDKVLHDHIRKLRRIITPSHTALRIPQEYLNEAPWPFAQQQISYISAYKTPREKLQSVIRCISSITTMLRMANDREPATDDLLPVLIYVIIMANPPYLLSTIEYINCFIGNKLEGLEQFYWTQFCSVVQFIKTLDYLE